MHDTTAVLSCQRHPQKLKKTGVKMVQKSSNNSCWEWKKKTCLYIFSCIVWRNLDSFYRLLKVTQSSQDKRGKKTNYSSLSKQTPRKKKTLYFPFTPVTPASFPGCQIVIYQSANRAPRGPDPLHLPNSPTSVSRSHQTRQVARFAGVRARADL